MSSNSAGLPELMTFISRAADGLILCETWENPAPSSSGEGVGESVSSYKQKAKKLLGCLRNSPARCSVDVDSSAVFHCFCDSGVAVVTLTTKSFPRRQAFTYLEDIHRTFLEELKKTLGSGVDLRSSIETITRPYHFISFDRVVQKKRTEYRDGSGSVQGNQAFSKINEGLNEVNLIVRRSLEEIMSRGDALDDVQRRAHELKDASFEFSRSARSLYIQALMRQYGIYAGVVAVFLLILYLNFFA